MIRLRWAAFLGQLATILAVHFALEIQLPLGGLAVVLALEVLSNAALEVASRRARSIRATLSARGLDHVLGGLMLADVALLCALLYLTGGLENPFSLFFFVHVVLGAVLLRRRWALVLTGAAFLGFTALAFVHDDLAGLEKSGPWQLRGAIIAFAGSVGVIVYFVMRVSRALEEYQHALTVEREHQVRSERIEALATLSAGAAHELATPLSTIAVVSKELMHHLSRVGSDEEALDDAELIRTEVARCRRILDQMTAESGSSAGEELVSVRIEELLDEVVAELPDPTGVEVEVKENARGLGLFIPLGGLAMAVRGVVKNALDASPAGELVRFSASSHHDLLELVVEDRGAGMSEAVVERALDPFFTTKEPGQGMGLGLFLARSTIERLGGELVLESRPGVGTRAHIRLPLMRVLPVSSGSR